MAKRTWQTQINGQPHIVRAQHSYWTGERTVWLDEQVVVSGRKLLEYGTRHTFDIDGQLATFEVVTNGFVYRYLLWIGDEPQTAIEDGGRLGALQNKAIRDRHTQQAYWNKLAELTGLQLFPRNDQPGLWQYRLLGRIDQYVVAVSYGIQPETFTPLFSIIVRFQPRLDSAATAAAIQSDGDLQVFRDKAKQRRGYLLTVEGSLAWVTLPYQLAKQAADAVAAQIKQLVTVIARYARPRYSCDGQKCAVKNGEPLQLVLINGSPMWLCGTCLAQLPAQVKKAEQQYQAAPSGLRRGLLAGAGVTLLGTLAWAVTAVLFQTMAVVISVATFIGIIKVMDRVRTKRTVKSLVVANGFAMVSAVLGVYLTAVWEVLTNSARHGSQLSIEQLMSTLQHSVAAYGPLVFFTIFFCLLGVVPYSFIIRHEQQLALQQAFQPTVEVVNVNL